MRHVANARFSCTIWSGRYSLVGSIGGHGGSEHDGAFDAAFDECSCGHTSAVEGAVEVDRPQLVDFFGGEVECRLVLCSTCVDDHSMDGAMLFDNLVDGFGYGLFRCDVCFQSVQLSRESLLYCEEVVASVANVN